MPMPIRILDAQTNRFTPPLDTRGVPVLGGVAKPVDTRWALRQQARFATIGLSSLVEIIDGHYYVSLEGLGLMHTL